ncbi:hypothetical protein G6F23_015476 [Rhizopus arrhizus]|nr:hypothetical protein G6F23_015476 [Rhizopus arrhizus]
MGLLQPASVTLPAAASWERAAAGARDAAAKLAAAVSSARRVGEGSMGRVLKNVMSDRRRGAAGAAPASAWPDSPAARWRRWPSAPRT